MVKASLSEKRRSKSSDGDFARSRPEAYKSINPFALSLSKGLSVAPFDRLRVNGSNRVCYSCSVNMMPLGFKKKFNACCIQPSAKKP